MSKRMKVFNIATPIIAGSLIVGTALWAISQAVLVKASDIAVPEAQKEATVTTTDGSTEIQLQWNGDRPDNNKLFGIAIYNENVEGESTSLLTVWNSRDVVINDDGTVDVVVAFKDDVVLHQTTTVNYSLRLTYLINGQEVTKTIDNFKLTYEVANVNVSIGGVPGLRIVEITPTYPVVGQRLDVAFNSIQYPITGVKSITTNGEVIPTNMYSMQVLGSGRDGHISIPGEWVKGDVVITLSNAYKATVVSPGDVATIDFAVPPEMNKEFKCQVTIPQGYAYTFQCIKCRNLTIDSSQYSFSVLQSTSGTTYYFTVNPKTVKGDLVFVFSEKPDVEIITNPSISSNLYDIEYFDALKGMDSEIVISFDQSIAEDVSFDALECDNEVLTEDEDFVFWWDDNWVYFDINGEALTGDLTFYFTVDQEEPQPILEPGIENYLIMTAEENSTVWLEVNGTFQWPDLYYSINRSPWIKWENASQSVKLSKGDYLCLRGDNKTGWARENNEYARFRFSPTSKISLSGNVMGLIDNGTNTDTIPSEYCFSYLFSADGISDGGQNAITSVSTTFLPAMNLTKNCYYRMFSNCDGLTGSTPNLPAKVLAPACYMSMFRDSGAISYINISANQFPTTGLAPFEYMFYGCPNMSYIGLAWMKNFSEDMFSHWVDDVSSSGTFAYSGPDKTRGSYAIPFGWNIVPNQESQYLTITALEPTSVGFLWENDSDIEYSLNDSKWAKFEKAQAGYWKDVLTMGVGDKLQLKGNNPNGLNHGMGSFTKFNFVGKVDISGNIMSLLDDGAFTQTNVPSYGLCALFHPSWTIEGVGRVDGINTSIHSLENLVLPARSVGVIGYGDMFYGNTNIVSGPRICARYVAKESFGCMFEDNACLQNVYIEYTGKLFDSDSDEIGFVRWLRNTTFSDPSLYYDGFDRYSGDEWRGIIPPNWTIKPAGNWWIKEINKGNK